MYDIAYWFLIFFIFSVIGWIAEVIFCYFVGGKLTNRGFLHGTYCPIYGFGALLIIIFLYDYNDDPIVLFILSVIFTSALEYFTSWAMEKIFNERWWDYSANFANINGRVCLFNSCCFGIGALAINYLIYPLVSKLVLFLSPNILIIISIICFVFILTDFVITTNLAFVLKKQIELVRENISTIKKKIPKVELFDKKLQKKLEPYHKLPKHFLNAFPNIKLNNQVEIKTLKSIYQNRKLKNLKKKKHFE